MNKHIFFLIVLLLSWSIPTTGQQNAPEPDKFGQLVLNQTSPDEAIQYLGKVESDKVDSLNASRLSKWLDPKHKDKLFRKLRFKDVGVMFSVDLSFLENKLIMIELEFRKNIKPENLKALFGVDFVHIGGPSPLPDKPGEYPRAFFPTGFPSTYYQVGVSAKTFLLATCTTSVTDDPGRVEKTRQISRILEKK